ncbi:MAG TPA: hypothetical protein VFR23_14325 [Jiangellaceae bacterium]|nr:hypothetical protein [Jiangellaceae bacterium]
MRQEHLNGPGVLASVAGHSVTETFDIRPAVPKTTKAPRHRTAHFLKHLGEMTVAMMLGMAVFGMASQAGLDAAGIDYDRLELEWPMVPALVMAFNMSAPMVWWMRRRGHSWSYTLEMAAAMFIPVLALTPLVWLSLISGDGLLVIQHVVMIPSMIVVMLRRRREFAH